jgi:hypothetical protein
VTVRKERSNQLNYVPTLFSYLYRKPASLLAFLRFNRFACVACFNLVEPNSEVNGHHGHHAKSPSKKVPQANTNPEQLSLPREMNCNRANSDQYRLGHLQMTGYSHLDRSSRSCRERESCAHKEVLQLLCKTRDTKRSLVSRSGPNDLEKYPGIVWLLGSKFACPGTLVQFPRRCSRFAGSNDFVGVDILADRILRKLRRVTQVFS